MSFSTQDEPWALQGPIASRPDPNAPGMEPGYRYFATDVGPGTEYVVVRGGLGNSWKTTGGGGGGSGPPLAIGYFDAGGALTGDPALTPLGTSYGRPQIHDTRQQVPPPLGGNLGPNVVWRQGASSADGDAIDLEGDGIVIYGPGPSGTMTGTNWTFARIKSDRFAIRAQVLGVNLDYMWRVDPAGEYFKDDLGTKTFVVDRLTGKRSCRTSTVVAAPGGAIATSTPAGRMVANAGDLSFTVTNPLMGANDEVVLTLASTPIGAPTFGVTARILGGFTVLFSAAAPGGFTLAYEIIGKSA